MGEREVKQSSSVPKVARGYFELARDIAKVVGADDSNAPVGRFELGGLMLAQETLITWGLQSLENSGRE